MIETFGALLISMAPPAFASFDLNVELMILVFCPFPYIKIAPPSPILFFKL